MPERVLPPNFKHQMNIAFRRRLTWKELFKAVFGYTMEIRMVVFTEHKPGKFAPVMDVNLSKELISPTPAQNQADASEPSKDSDSSAQGTACNNRNPGSSPNTAGSASDRGRTDRTGSNRASSAAILDERRRVLEQRQLSAKASSASAKPTSGVPPSSQPSTTPKIAKS